MNVFWIQNAIFYCTNKIKNIIWRSCCRRNINKLQQISLLHFKLRLILSERSLGLPVLFWLPQDNVAAGGCKNYWLHRLTTAPYWAQGRPGCSLQKLHIVIITLFSFMILTWYWMNNFVENLLGYMTVLEVMLGLDRP